MEYPKPKDGLLHYFFWHIFLCLLFILGNSILVFATPIPVVRVMVERERGKIEIEGFDLIVTDAASGAEILHDDKQASIPMTCKLSGRIELKSRGLAGLIHKKKTTGPLRVQSLGGFIRIHGRQYRDDLYIYAAGGECVVVNHVDLEKYIAGLLNSEMSATWNIQALKAQAVAARTYALYQMKRGVSAESALRQPFDLESTERDQVYEGAHQERYRALRAVQETRGQVLTYHGQVIKAFYHSTCGGQTENAESVWGGKYPYLRSVKCGYCNNSPRFQWTYELPQQELEQKLRSAHLLSGQLRGIRIAQRNSMGRAGWVDVLGTDGVRRIKGTQLRDVLGTVHLRSTDFQIVASPVASRGLAALSASTASAASKASNPSVPAFWIYVFHGFGSGHGVGMCQYGAKTQAELGRTYAQILKYYYPATKLSKIY